MKNLYKSLADQNEQRKKYFLKPLFYGREVKKIVEKMLPGAKVILFGSAVSGKLHPESDFDILIVTDHHFSDIFKQSKFKLAIQKPFPNNPFEIHIATQKQFENWYKRFIKNNYLQV
ncbi:MAG: nucleotidyltransferase domain-containing protein [Microgenomates group bacterium]